MESLQEEDRCCYKDKTTDTRNTHYKNGAVLIKTDDTNVELLQEAKDKPTDDKSVDSKQEWLTGR